MVSMPSLHFFRWTEQLKDAGHDIYWFDVTDGGSKVERISWVNQIVGWKLKWKYPGRYFIKNKFPKVYALLQQFNENNTAKIFEQKLLEIQPDVVHSFALHVSCDPIIEVMNKYKLIKWIYSSWGSDLYSRKENPTGKSIINRVLPRIDYLFTDCNRDYEIAKNHGFDGKFLGVFPGGGGYNLNSLQSFQIPYNKRKIILVKGYQGVHGKCIEVLKVLIKIKEYLVDYQIVIFGADNEVVNYVMKEIIHSELNILIKGKILHDEVLALMGNAKLYIGFSNSDGLPNTLLEAICSGCLPLQSNPGGATTEVIIDNYNGFLLNLNNIEEQILRALNTEDFSDGLKYNSNELAPKLSFDFVKNKVLKSYNKI